MIYRIYFTVLLAEIILYFTAVALEVKEDCVFAHIISVIAFALFVTALIFAFHFIWTIGR